MAAGGRAPASTAARRRRRRAARCSRSSRSSTCRGRRSRRSIDGVEMDLGARRYETFDDLYQYCIRVASAVGLMCVRDLRLHAIPASRQYAIDLGVALQLTNILRDVPGDLARGRVYLPQEDLARARRHRGGSAATRPIDAGAACGRRTSRRCSRQQARARARLLRARRPRAAARRRAPARRRRDHGRHLPRDPRPHRARATTTCSRRSSACRGPRRALIAATTWLRTLVTAMGPADDRSRGAGRRRRRRAGSPG